MSNMAILFILFIIGLLCRYSYYLEMKEALKILEKRDE